eukprot:10940218-Prorocentrum_lima.AAC.1
MTSSLVGSEMCIRDRSMTASGRLRGCNAVMAASLMSWAPRRLMATMVVSAWSLKMRRKSRG